MAGLLLQRGLEQISQQLESHMRAAFTKSSESGLVEHFHRRVGSCFCRHSFATPLSTIVHSLCRGATRTLQRHRLYQQSYSLEQMVDRLLHVPEEELPGNRFTQFFDQIIL